MPQFDMNITTPGSAVASTIQEILARRREEKQMEFLNRLREQESSRAGEQLELQRKSEERSRQLTEAQLAESKNRLVESRLKDLPVGATASQVPEDDPLRTELLRRFQTAEKAGPQAPEELATPEDTAGMAPISFYPGSAEQQEQERKRGVFEQLRGQLPENATPFQRMAVDIAQEGFPQMLPSAFTQNRMYDPNTNKFIDVPAGTNVDVLPWKPNPPTGFRDQVYQVEDETGNLIGSVSLTPEELNVYTRANPTHKLRPAGFKPTEDKGLTQGLRLAMSNALTNLDIAQSELDGAFFKGDEQKRVDIARSAVQNIAGQIASADRTTPEEIKKLGLQIMSHPKLSKMSTAAALPNIGRKNPATGKVEPTQLNPTQLAQLENFMRTLRGEPQAVPAAPIVN